MKNLTRDLSVAALAVIFVCSLGSPRIGFAAVTPSLGAAATYGILASTYTNVSGGTTVNGDVGFTTAPAVTPGGTHTNYGSGAPYATAGSDQNAALSDLDSETCDFSWGAAVDLSTDITHGPIGIYTPGVYCSTGAMNVGGPITLTGSGTFVFRAVGALDSTAGAIVSLAGGASACDVFWTPTAATTLGANTTFAGTVIGNAGITIGANTTWSGRALAFGGTVTTDTTTITVPTCGPAPATLHVIKVMNNENGGTATSSDFNIHVQESGVEVTGSPAVGTSTPGTSYSLAAGTYVVSEDDNALYTATFSGDCDSDGSITLSPGDDETCTITNTDIAPVAPSSGGGGGGSRSTRRITPEIGILKTATPFSLPAGSGPVTYDYTVWNIGGRRALVDVVVVDDKCSPVVLLSGDSDDDEKLDVNESWKYSCRMTLLATTENIATATGYSDDSYHTAATSTDDATVVVGVSSTISGVLSHTSEMVFISATPTPGLPNAGSLPEEKGFSWNLIAFLSAAFVLTPVLAPAALKRIKDRS